MHTVGRLDEMILGLGSLPSRVPAYASAIMSGESIRKPGSLIMARCVSKAQHSSQRTRGCLQGIKPRVAVLEYRIHCWKIIGTANVGTRGRAWACTHISPFRVTICTTTESLTVPVPAMIYCTHAPVPGYLDLHASLSCRLEHQPLLGNWYFASESRPSRLRLLCYILVSPMEAVLVRSPIT